MDCKPAAAASSSPSLDSTFISNSSPTEQSEQSPRADENHLPRQKRKRTSPEDQIILEAAYKRDPKPDKVARLELVKQVALGEKEVQIWFQNRRQSSRRKSRPLLPHEIAQYQTSRTTASSTTLASTHDSEGLVYYQTGEFVSRTGHSAGGPSSSDDAESDDSGSVADRPQMDTVRRIQRPETDTGHHTDLDQYTTSDVARISASSSPSAPFSTQIAAPVGHLASRTLRHSFSSPPMPPPPSTGTLHRSLTKSSSFVRLSMNAEGKAEVTTKDASSPSPPRPQQVIIPPQASVTPVQISSLPPIHGLNRALSGRSRDSRSWEFWCDKESRSELETAAKKDASGSAAGAIGLLRTASGRSVLGSLPSKRNGGFQSLTGPVKRSKHDHKRSSLQRSSTSFGRLQGKGSHVNSAPLKLKPSGSAKTVHIESTDSDKENWSPGGDAESDSASQPAQDLRFGTHGASKMTRSRETDPEADAELAAFMRGGRKRPNESGDADLDCVQGLLSLSQGNWR